MAEEKRETVAVVGLGYVGIQLAAAFSAHIPVIGFDINREKVELYRRGTDPTGEVGDGAIAASGIRFTNREEEIGDATAYLVAVPTPVDREHKPDLAPLEGACRSVGRNLGKGDLVVFESTVYPGATEEYCVPILEELSGLQCGRDFDLGYSPERLSPGDRGRSLLQVTKVISGQSAAALERVAALYGLLLEEKLLHRASCIRVAEASKLVENTQRDILIAAANEFSQIFHRAGLDTAEVLRCASTKWNFSPVSPGLVGGHCIGVDPYYMMEYAGNLSCRTQMVSSARAVNEGYGGYLADQVAELLGPGGGKAVICGFTYKRDVRDIRNTKVADLAAALRSRGIGVRITDYLADAAQVEEEYGEALLPEDGEAACDAVIVAVPHRRYRETPPGAWKARYPGSRLFADIGQAFPQRALEEAGYRYWRA